MIILEFEIGSLTKSNDILKQTIITIKAKSNLNCSPFNLDVYLEPNCAPITPPIKRKIAKTKSTDWLYVA